MRSGFHPESMQITGRIGLIGDPVAHSLSPAFQQPAFEHIGINIRYELWPTTSEQIDRRLEQMRSGEIYGANVTAPHKESFFHAMDEVSSVASRAGAVNTIVVRAGTLIGDNTDVYGSIVPLRERSFPFTSSTAVVLGAGGAARAIVIGLLDAGIAHVMIANRTLTRAAALAESVGNERVAVCTLDQAADASDNAGLLINATALGWENELLPIDADIFDVLGDNAIAYDLTYRSTPFLEAARAAGVWTLDGLPMLVHQGARSFEIWTGVSAPVELMMRAATHARDRSS